MGQVPSNLMLTVPQHIQHVHVIEFDHPVDGVTRKVLLIGEYHANMSLKISDLKKLTVAWGIIDITTRVLQRVDGKCIDFFLESQPLHDGRAHTPASPLNGAVVPHPNDSWYEFSGVGAVPVALDPQHYAQRSPPPHMQQSKIERSKIVRRLMQIDGQTAIPNMTRVHHWDTREQRFFWEITQAVGRARNLASQHNTRCARELKRRIEMRRQDPRCRFAAPIPAKIELHQFPLLGVLFGKLVDSVEGDSVALRGVLNDIDDALRQSILVLRRLNIVPPNTSYWLTGLLHSAAPLPDPFLSRGGKLSVLHRARLTHAAKLRSGLAGISTQKFADIMPAPHLMMTDAAVLYNMLALKRRTGHDNVFRTDAAPTPFATKPAVACSDVAEVMIMYAGHSHTRNIAAMFQELASAGKVRAVVTTIPILMSGADRRRVVDIWDILQRLGSRATADDIRNDVRLGRRMPRRDPAATLGDFMFNKEFDRAMKIARRLERRGVLTEYLEDLEDAEDTATPAAPAAGGGGK